MREDEVVNIFTAWLRRRGWTVEVSPTAADVVARRDDRTFIAEVKGDTTGPGLDVDTGYGQLLRRMEEGAGEVSYGIVVPRRAAKAARRAPEHVLRRLDIAVYVIGEDGEVACVAGRDHLTESRVRADGEGGHPVDRFFASVDALPSEIYPDELVPVAGRHVEGVAGFPAGRGLYAECGWDHRVPPPFPFGGLMLVGNHLDAEDVYVEKLAAGAANGDPCPGAPRMRFWTMLYALLDEAGIDRSSIFVTNVHPALLRGRQPTGRVAASDVWLDACAKLLREQIEVMQPRAVAAMGVPAQEFLSAMFEVDWRRVPDFVPLGEDASVRSLAAIRHPSAAQSREARSREAAVLRESLGMLPR